MNLLANGGINWTQVITGFLAFLGVVVSAGATVLSLYLRTRTSRMEDVIREQGERIAVLEEETKRCEAGRAADQARHAEEIKNKNTILETEWPSDDFNSNDLAAKIHKAAVVSGLKVSIAQIGYLAQRIKKRKTDLEQDTKPKEEFFS